MLLQNHGEICKQYRTAALRRCCCCPRRRTSSTLELIINYQLLRRLCAAGKMKREKEQVQTFGLEFIQKFKITTLLIGYHCRGTRHPRFKLTRNISKNDMWWTPSILASGFTGNSPKIPLFIVFTETLPPTPLAPVLKPNNNIQGICRWRCYRNCPLA